MTTLDDPLSRVLDARTARAMAAKLDLHTVSDLVRHYPRRYARRGELTDLSRLRQGEQVTIVGRIVEVDERQMRNRRGLLTVIKVSDGRTEVMLTFFGSRGQHRSLRTGMHGLFAGKVSTYQGKRQLTHPEMEIIGDDDVQRAVEFVTELIPVYPAAQGLPSWQIARAVRVVLDVLEVPEDPLPERVRRRHRLPALRDALLNIHRPTVIADAERAKSRLKWDEAFVLQVALAKRRHAAAALPATPRPRRAGGLLEEFDRMLPFTLTGGQREVGETIAAELAGDHPMHRLLQGEVGSGKTACAVRAMLQVVDAGGQAALLAPTEVLAQQHHRSITGLLGPLAEAGLIGGDARGTRVALLTGSQGAAARRAALLDAASGQAGIVIGTHALLQRHVQFADLGLVVIDEQHRFGVEQRDALREKTTGGRPHVLVMTATPIPRTVAMTVYGDLDVATLTELPKGRSPISTFVVAATERPHYLQRTWQRLREEVAKGHQCYIVCPRIGDTDGAGDGPGDGDGAGDTGGAGSGRGRSRAERIDDGFDDYDVLDPFEDDFEPTHVPRPGLGVTQVAPMLAEGPLRGVRFGIMHGRLPAEEKDRAMRAFAAGEIDILVSTTVIEVGVDVPNASTMVVLDADRFGVSQLHQLRGRVGRGSAPGLCLLVTEMEEGHPARRRLDAVAETLDGFELSRLDLAQRREGDVLGASQSGHRTSLRILTLLSDEEIIRAARTEATDLVTADPDLTGHPALAAELAVLLDEDRAGYLEKT